MRTLLFAILSIVAASSSPAAQAASTLFYKSSPGSYIGQGKTETFASTTGATFSAETGIGMSLGNQYRYLDLFVEVPGHSWFSRYFTLGVGAPWGDLTLAPGLYAGASRDGGWGSSGPHLAFSGDGRGNNETSGWFRVLEFEATPGGQVTKAAIDFLQFDGSGGTTWTAGSWRFNSDLPVNTSVPEPGRAGLMLIGAAGFLSRRRRALA